MKIQKAPEFKTFKGMLRYKTLEERELLPVFNGLMHDLFWNNAKDSDIIDYLMHPELFEILEHIKSNKIKTDFLSNNKKKEKTYKN